MRALRRLDDDDDEDDDGSPAAEGVLARLSGFIEVCGCRACGRGCACRGGGGEVCGGQDVSAVKDYVEMVMREMQWRGKLARVGPAWETMAMEPVGVAPQAPT